MRKQRLYTSPRGATGDSGVIREAAPEAESAAREMTTKNTVDDVPNIIDPRARARRRNTQLGAIIRKNAPSRRRMSETLGKTIIIEKLGRTTTRSGTTRETKEKEDEID